MLVSDDRLALSLDRFCEAFGAIRKGVKDRNGGYIPKRWGYVQSYLKLDLVIVLHIHSRTDDCHYHLVFHRVPSDARNFNSASRARDGGVNITGNSRGNSQADCVLPIRQLGDFSNCVVSPGVSVSSRVWLFPFDDIPKFGGNGAIFQGSIEVGKTGFPREIQVALLGHLSNGNARSVNGLVEGIPKIPQRLGRLSGQGTWKGFEYLELVNFIAGFRVDIHDLSVRLLPLNDRPKGLGTEEIEEAHIKLVNCFPCPSDAFLRAIKCG